MAEKKKKKSVIKTLIDVEEMIAGLRRRSGHLPTLLSEAKRKEKEGGK